MRKKKKNRSSIKSEKEFKKFSGYIEGRFNEFSKHLLLDFVTVKFGYPMRQPADLEGTTRRMVMTIHYVKRYRQVYLSVYDEAYNLYKENSFEELDRALIHELNHIHTIPLADLAKERYVTDNQIHEAAEELTELMTEYMVKNLNINYKKNVKLKKKTVKSKIKKSNKQLTKKLWKK